MNLSGQYRPGLGAVVCSCITPYQKLEDYEKNRLLKDKTYLLADEAPVAWEVDQEAFEGEGGLARPDAITKARLAGGDAIYELPTCALQYQMTLAAGEAKALRFAFGPAFDDSEIAAIRKRLFAPGAFAREAEAYAHYVQLAEGCSCYNHAAAFYAYGLYTERKADRAFAVLRNMIPGPDPADYLQRGQLPVFIPNYYRGGHKLFLAPRAAQASCSTPALWRGTSAVCSMGCSVCVAAPKASG